MRAICVVTIAAVFAGTTGSNMHLLIVLFIVVAVCALIPQIVDEVVSDPKGYGLFVLVAAPVVAVWLMLNHRPTPLEALRPYIVWAILAGGIGFPLGGLARLIWKEHWRR